jgi:hypothetical protein
MLHNAGVTAIRQPRMSNQVSHILFTDFLPAVPIGNRPVVASACLTP